VPPGTRVPMGRGRSSLFYEGCPGEKIGGLLGRFPSRINNTRRHAAVHGVPRSPRAARCRRGGSACGQDQSQNRLRRRGLAHPIHERLRLNQTERADIATSTFPGTSVMWHTRFWKAAEDGLFMTTVNKTG
jgi:hypothetical protein